ncbi:SxtJ family membrane protein [Pseudodesulfovibrio sp. zrk46]|uniref:SxtJ family membrane protein n=1 Tax=Pseudodesulfovibrio sp. zrk46 TaxID=2725288 RepID=UPI0014493DF1|nr:SxtJ family membrane protein [Pseudodesulfovibrio sp. zrk46]QJB57276.1 hypothetical protein HFN16_13045 [Pseudodesulfovibrio sp. zrk46]
MIDTKKDASAGFLPAKLTTKECSDTGMAMVLICLLIGLLLGHREGFVAATILLVINMTWSKAFYLPAKVWLGFSHLLGTVMSKVILTLVFFVILTPLALLRRILGHDPMQLNKWKKGRNSVFFSRDHSFTPEEIERPY